MSHIPLAAAVIVALLGSSLAYFVWRAWPLQSDEPDEPKPETTIEQRARKMQ